MKYDYTALDTAILETIKRRDCLSFTGINTTPEVSAEATRAADMANERMGVGRISPFATGPWRAVDRRLQVLRKAGKIRFAGKGWVLA